MFTTLEFYPKFAKRIIRFNTALFVVQGCSLFMYWKCDVNGYVMLLQGMLGITWEKHVIPCDRCFDFVLCVMFFCVRVNA